MTILHVFGERIPDAELVAERKFRDCPWQFFDGVPDQFPNRLVWGDFAITRVMGSGIAESMIPELDGNDIEKVNSILAAIPVSASVAEADEDLALYERVNVLFKTTRAHRLGMSRIAKVLCRKRPSLIPMLDSVLTGFLWKVAHGWDAGVAEGGKPPGWFESEWNAWADWDHPRIYLRMVREALRPALENVRAIRAHVSAVPETGVPGDAPLLRIWEATLFKHLSSS
jgi:hypothetical protein